MLLLAINKQHFWGKDAGVQEVLHSTLEPQDRFEQSVLTEKLKIERQDFSQRLVEYLDLLVSAREDLREDRTDAAGEKLKNAAEISRASKISN